MELKPPAYAVNSPGLIRINHDARAQLQHLSSGEPVAVIDDFLLEPDELRRYAVDRVIDFYMPPKSYPGVVLDVDAEPMQDIYRFIRSTLGKAFSFYRGDAKFESMLSMTTVQPDDLSNLQRLCHSDPPPGRNRRNYAFVLYLFDNEALGGTGFYRWKEKEAIIEATALEAENPDEALAFLKERFETYQKPAHYLTETNEIAERLHVIPAKFNRLVFYAGNVPHSAQIASPELLTSDFESGRLTLNCFASVRPK
jgi:hypothetical protein